jgi:hypothetical protein
MARPIKETPVLTGDDARRFEEAIQKNNSQRVSRESYERALKVFDSVKRSTNKLGTETA